MDRTVASGRRHPRYRPSGTQLCSLEFDRRRTAGEVLNISESGLCVLSERRVPADEEVTVIVSDVELRVKRVWHRPVSIEPLRYLTGFIRTDEVHNLLAEFAPLNPGLTPVDGR